MDPQLRQHVDAIGDASGALDKESSIIGVPVNFILQKIGQIML